MIIGTCEIELLIYESNSLKEKRHVIKSIIERLKSRYNISVAEIDYLDLWNRSVIGIVTVSNAKNVSEGVIDRAIEFVYNDERVEVLSCTKNIY